MKFYRINVSGQKFFLSKDNIYSDAPNVFTERFEAQPKSTRMAVDRSPKVFDLVHKHLQGYDIDVTGLSPDVRRHLLEDALYYRLPRLRARLASDIESQPLLQEVPLVDYLSSDSSSDSEEEQFSPPQKTHGHGSYFSNPFLQDVFRFGTNTPWDFDVRLT